MPASASAPAHPAIASPAASSTGAGMMYLTSSRSANSPMRSWGPEIKSCPAARFIQPLRYVDRPKRLERGGQIGNQVRFSAGLRYLLGATTHEVPQVRPGVGRDLTSMPANVGCGGSPHRV